MDIKIIYYSIIAILSGLIGYYWFYKLKNMIEEYLKFTCEIISCKNLRKRSWISLYSRVELEGSFNGRNAIAGVQYVGLGFEWMPLPYIKIKLKDVIRYNYDRIPDFTYIQRGWLIFKIKDRFTWGVFDKRYSHFFTKEFVNVTLTRLAVIADDIERGKTMEEIFK